MHSAHRTRETVDLLRQETLDFIPPYLWHPNIPDLNPVNYKIRVIMQHRVYQTKICIVDERRVIDVWCGLEQLTIRVALTTNVEDFERASLRKADNSNTTCELTILILSVSVTFCVTFVWLLRCYRVTSFIQKVCLQRRQLGLQECLFLQVRVVAKLGHGGKFYSTFWRRYLSSDMQKKIIKIGQQLLKLQQML